MPVVTHSQDRISTTHTGSLPFPDALVDLLGAVARGEPVDLDALTFLVAVLVPERPPKPGPAGTALC